MPPKITHRAFSFDFQSRKSDIVTPCEIKNPYDTSVFILKGGALWDTGATHSVVNLRTVGPLSLIPVAKEIITGVHGAQEVSAYVVEIVLPQGLVYKNWRVFAADIDRHDLLVGMDIIGMGDFSICGGKFFSYGTPSFDRPIDFVEKLEKAKNEIAQGKNNG